MSGVPARWRARRATGQHRWGSALGGAPSRCAALALALVLAAPPARAAAPRAAPAPAAAPLRFEALAWDLPAAAAERALAQRGWTRAPAEDGEAPRWRGRALGQRVLARLELDTAGRLVAVEARVLPASHGSALQRYADLVAAMRARHGAPAAEIAPGRPVTAERLGHFGRVLERGPRTAATLWTDAAGAGGLVELDGDDTLHLRYESPRWDAAHAAADSAAGR